LPAYRTRDRAARNESEDDMKASATNVVGLNRVASTPVGLDGLPLGECTRDPERWTTVADDEAKSICRSCPRRWACAREAVELPKAEGLWAGIVVPETGRGRGHALRQLRELAERNGYPVRARRVFLEPVLVSA
jgi:WhiB family redox-sensing transcriptional regulator